MDIVRKRENSTFPLGFGSLPMFNITLLALMKNSETRTELKNELKREIRDEIRDELKKEIKQELKEELRKEFGSDDSSSFVEVAECENGEN